MTTKRRCGALTPTQRRALAGELRPPHGRVDLVCDGDWIALCVAQWTAMRYRVIILVNGDTCAAWMRGDREFPQQKYMRRVERSIFNPSQIQALERAYGAAEAAKMGVDFKMVSYSDNFASGAAAISHLARVCTTIRVATPGEIPDFRAAAERARTP